MKLLGSSTQTNGLNISVTGNSFLGSLTHANTATRTYTLPDNTGTVALLTDIHAPVTLGTANGLSLATQTLSLGLASSGVTGALSGTDWNTFNGKQAALNGTGFVKVSGTTVSYDNTSYINKAGDTGIGALSMSALTADGVLFNAFKGANSDGYNVWIGGGGQSSVGASGTTYMGSKNSAFGYLALYYNTTGYYNSAFGYLALYYNTTGYSNSAIGTQALYYNTTGYANSAMGLQALCLNTTGSYNSALGYQALYYNTAGSHNSAIGFRALYNLAPTAKAISAFADYSGTVVGTVKATSTAHGRSTGDSVIISGTVNYNATYTITVIDADNFYFTATWVASETTGWWTLSGYGASNNTAFGYNTGLGITTGSGNTILGANVTGLSANLTNNIILANGTGAIKAQHDGTNWTLTGGVSMSALSATTGTFSSSVNSITATIDPLTGSANAYLYLVGRNAGVSNSAVIFATWNGGITLTPAASQVTTINSALVVSSSGAFSGALSATTGSFSGALSSPSFVSGILKGNGSTISAAVANTDYTTPAYTQSKGVDLVVNGTGLLKSNYNFSSFTFDGTDAYYSTGCFSNSTYNAMVFSDELMPIDPNQVYKLSVMAKSNPHAVGSHAFIGVALYDADGLNILAQYRMYQANTLTTLAADLVNGATTIQLTSAANWNNAAGANGNLRGIIVWNYVNSLGYAFPALTYSRNVWLNIYADGGISGNTITLSAPWAGGTIPAGTQLSNSSSGSTYSYIAASSVDIPATWTNYSGYIGGVDLTGTNNQYAFAPGTAAVKLLFLLNRDVTGNTTKIANVSFKIRNVTADLNNAVSIGALTATTGSFTTITGTSFNSITGLASVAPLMDGTAAIGTSTLTARQDHVHPVDTSRQAALNGTGFVKVSGTTVSYDNSTYLTGTKVDSFNTRTGAVTLTSSDVTTALNYTPINKAGDTFTGAVVLNTGAFPSASTGVSLVTLVGGSLGSPWSGKTYFGDGTGWKYAFSRRSASVDTDVLTIQDNGNISSLGSISAGGQVTGTQFNGSGAGLTGTANSLSIGGNAATATTATNVSAANNTTNANYYPVFATSQGTSVALGTGSGFTFNPSTGTVLATNFGATSDERLKTNITPIFNPIDKVKNLNGFYFNWNELAPSLDKTTTHVGVSAQHTLKTFPEAVVEGEEYLSVTYDAFIPLLIECVKEQQKEIEELKRLIHDFTK